MFGSGRTGTTSVAHKVFDSWPAPEPQPWSEGNHAHHVFDTIPDPRGRVLHVVVHQYQQLVSPELMSQVFSAYGTVEEMFHSPHQDSPTPTSSIFIEYAHASMADDALHGLHGLYLYRDDCQLEIRHANSQELQAFYGYSAPSFSEHQFELLQQLQNDLQALSRDLTCRLVDVRMGTKEPTPPSQNNLSVAIPPISACESFRTEDKQAEQKCKNQEHEKLKKHAPAQLQLELESLLPLDLKIFDSKSVTVEASNDIHQVLHQWPNKKQELENFLPNGSCELVEVQDKLVKRELDTAPMDQSGNLKPYHGIDLEPRPTSQNILSDDVCLVLEYKSPCPADKQPELDCTEYGQQLKQAPQQRKHQFEHCLRKVVTLFDSTLILPTIISPYACAANEEAHMDNLDPVLLQWPTKQQQPQDSSSATIDALTVDILSPHEEEAQQDAQVEKLLTTVISHIRQPWPPPMNWKYCKSITSVSPHGTQSQHLVPCMLALAHDNRTVQEPFGYISALCEDMQTIPLMLPWDPGNMHCTHMVISMPISKGKFSCLQLNVHWVTTKFIVLYSTCLGPLCTGFPWEDSREIHALHLTEFMWSHFVVVFLTQVIELSDVCQAPQVHENPKVHSFNSNEVRPTIITSHRCDLISQVGADEQWRSVTWKNEIRATFLLLLTSGAPGVHLLLPWNLGSQKMQRQFPTIVGAAKQMIFRKSLLDWPLYTRANICMALVVWPALSLTNQFSIYCISEQNLKTDKFWDASYKFPKATVDRNVVKNDSEKLSSQNFIESSSQKEVHAFENAIELCAFLPNLANTIISTLFLTKSGTDLIAHGQWEQGPHGSEIQNMLLLFFLQYVSAWVQLLQHLDTRKSKLLGIKLLTRIRVQAPESTAKIITLFPKATKVHCNYLLAVEVSTFTCNTGKTGGLASYYKVSTFSSWELLPIGLSWNSGCLAICGGLHALNSDSKYRSQVLVIMHNSNAELLSGATHCPSVSGYFIDGFWPNKLQNIPSSIRPCFDNPTVSHNKLHQLQCIAIIAEIKDLQFSTKSCIGPEQNVVQLVFLESDNTYAVGESTTWDPGIILYWNLQPDSDTHYKISSYNWSRATKGRWGFYLKKISNMLHKKILGWAQKIWIVSFMPP